MASERQPVLLHDRGDLPSLVALLLEPEPARLVLWHVRERDEAAPRRLDMVRRHVELFAPRELVVSDAWEPRRNDAARPAPAAERTLTMVQAVVVARHHGCTRIVWPAQEGPSAARVEAAVDRATGVTELAALDAATDGAAAGGPAPPRGPTIDLPIVDLADDQVIDLADDLGAPPDAFWTCEGGGVDPCGTCGGCLRWRGLRLAAAPASAAR